MTSGFDPATRPRVIVVDADDRVRASLIGLLAIGDRLEIVGDAGRMNLALELAARTRPDIVVIDPRLPELDGGLDCIRQLRADLPAVRIIALTCPETAEDDSLTAVVDGSVRKTFRPSDLQAAVLAAGPTRPD